jgi:exopolysaccharide production protein ExoZ
MQQRLTQVQLLRAVAAFVVVASHLAVIDHKYSIDPVAPKWLEVGFSGVDLFFVISGFIMTVITEGSRRGPGPAAAFLMGRAGRIYPLYWVVTAALVLVWMYRPDMVFSADPAPPDFVTSFTLWPDTRVPLLAVGWTLVHEMYFYLVFALLLLAPRAILVPALLVWAAVITAGIALNAGAGSPEARLVLHPLTFEFIAGAFAGLAFLRWRDAGALPALGIGLSGFMAAAIFVVASGLVGDSDFWTDSVQRPLLFAAPSALIIYGLAGFDLRGRPASRFGEALGDQSYALYLTHVLSLSAAGRIWAMLPQSSAPWDNIAALALMTLIAYMAAELAYRLIDRPAHDLVRRLRRRMPTAAAAASAPAP